MKNFKDMKKIKNILKLSAGLMVLLFISCENKEIEFPNYDHTAVFFAYQYPVRTIVLGEDIFDNTLDNEHRCKIYATMGGVYKNKQTIDIGIAVDNTLCDSLYFDDGFISPVKAMPADYYTLSANNIIIENELMDGVEVQLTDSFFADSNSINNTYVIPLRMTDVVNADSILSGIPKFDGAKSTNSSDWDVLPKNYTLYCVKFVNAWHGNYLRRGRDIISEDGSDSTVVRHETYVENDQAIMLNTVSLNAVEFPTDYQNKLGNDLNISFKLSFDDSQSCTVSPIKTDYFINDTCRVYNITATGNGKFVENGEKNSWGNKDRNGLYLNYEIGYEVEISYPVSGLPSDIQQVAVNTVDTLVVRDRDVTIETYSPTYKAN